MSTFVELVDTPDGKQPQVTPEWSVLLANLFTNPGGKVSALSGMPWLQGAAAMARLSRSANSLEQIYLLEFAEKEGAVDELMERVILGYGDDSVQQLCHVRFVVEEVSNLMTKVGIEQGRIGTGYLERSTRYVFYDRKINGRWRYYTPRFADETVTSFYEDHLDKIFSLYSEAVRGLVELVRQRNPYTGTTAEERTAWLNSTRAQACDMARIMLPVATTSTVGVVMSTQTVEQLYMRLCSLNLSEGHVLAEAILRESRKVAGPFLTRADLPDRGGATIAYLANTRAAVRQLAERIAVEEKWDTTPAGEVTVKMPWYAPADEGELAAHVLWEDSHASLEEIRSKLSPDRVKEVLRAAIGERLNRRHKPGRAFENAFFTYEIVGDYGTFRDMHRMRIVNDMRWQRLTPYHGFDIPEGVKGTEFERLFYEAFALSEELFEYLVQKGEGEETAQYAVLLGHRMRYRMTPNLRELYHILELRSQPAGHPGYRVIAQQMFALLEAVYPITAAGMRFMNMGEDPGLTRMAAELATQRKRAILGMTPELLEE